MAPYSYVKYLLVFDKPRTTGIIEHSHSTGVIERGSKLRFVTHVTLVTHDTHVFYEIKKLNDFGGLVNMLPKATRNLCGCYGGYTLLTYGDPSTTPAHRGVTRRMHPQCWYTGTHNTEPAQSFIEASKSPRYVNTLPQHTQRA